MISYGEVDEVVHAFGKKHAVADPRTRWDKDQPPGNQAHHTKVVHQIACSKHVCRQTNAEGLSKNPHNRYHLIQ